MHASSDPIVVLATIILVHGFWFSNTTCTPATSNTQTAVVMLTDEERYAQGARIRLSVQHSLATPIWYIGYAESDLAFWTIERAENKEWTELPFRLPVIDDDTAVCRLVLHEPPIGQVTDLQPNTELVYEWNQQICIFNTPTEPTAPELIARGRYRFALKYSLTTVVTLQPCAMVESGSGGIFPVLR